MRRERTHLAIAVATAAVLWFYMFSPWTKGWPDFWLVMACSATILTTLGLVFTPDRKALLKVERPALQVLAGVIIAFALWGVFWVGDKVSAWMFSFARGEVDLVYSMRQGIPSWVIAALLLLLIGPAEELFWRGYVQRTLSRTLGGKRPEDKAFVITALVYALVHVWSLNFMLIMAALVAGCVWGLIYRIRPGMLPALIVSHALWDVLVFIVLPI
ncbi:MAG: CPBP family intramembrane metalloprotease [Bacteroidales bacterium]|nr:CPBP family intramembrane metalloprotease [Bacteroidales bacterium]